MRKRNPNANVVRWIRDSMAPDARDSISAMFSEMPHSPDPSENQMDDEADSEHDSKGDAHKVKPELCIAESGEEDEAPGDGD